MKEIDGQLSSNVAYRTERGTMYHGTAEEVLSSPGLKDVKGMIQLIFTSPPYPLNRKKKYGNLQGDEYVEWLAGFSECFKEYLAPEGSIVIELGNAWEPGEPVMSTLALKALLRLLEAGEFHLCQEIVCFNPARLPTPAQWVNLERIRLKDAFTRLWWMSPTPRPKADNRRVLRPYSKAMKKLLKRRRYNAGERPSEHNIGEESFFKDNGGAIPPNVLEIANTSAHDPYLQYCRDNAIQRHPARMPMKLAEFIIQFLTDHNDLVFDPFAGSNTTGSAAESLGRRWIAIEPECDYVQGSMARFEKIETAYEPFEIPPRDAAEASLLDENSSNTTETG